MDIEQRRFERYHCHFQLEVIIEKEKWLMHALDISQEGLRLKSVDINIIIEPKKIVAIKLPYHKKEGSLVIRGEVRHYSYEENGQVIFGVQTLDMDRETKKSWFDILERIKNKDKKYIDKV